MPGSVTRIRSRWGTLRPLIPLALLVVSACTQAAAPPSPYAGVQARTPLDKIPAGGDMKNFTLVGSNPLLDPKFNLPQGMNGGITAAGKCLYVGSNTAMHNASILDMSDMTKPTKVGEITGIPGKGMGIEAIEAVADLNLLAVTVRGSFGLTLAGGKAYVFPVKPEDKTIGIAIYDITDCTKPQMVSKIDAFNELTHYMTLWRDPKKPDRVLASLSYSSNQDGVDIRMWDLQGCPKSCNPKMVAEWGLRAQLGIPQTIVTKFEGGTRSDGTTTHDNTLSIDGKRIHLAQTKYGYMQLDSSALAEGRSCIAKAATSATAQGHCISVLPSFKPLASFGTETANSHGVVKIPGRPFVAIQHEGGECPYGGITFAYVGDQEGYINVNRATNQVTSTGTSNGAFRGDAFPRHVGSFGIPENNVERCPKPGAAVQQGSPATGVFGTDVLRGYFTVHNALAFPSVLFATWYQGGLRAVDITNPYTPFELGFFFNKPAPEVRWCAEASTGPCGDPEVDAEGVPVRQKQLLPPDVVARSYPIVMNGYIVYSDENMGVYVLKYTGPYADEIPQQGLCISHNPSVTKPGFEPCPPYNDTYHK